MTLRYARIEVAVARQAAEGQQTRAEMTYLLIPHDQITEQMSLSGLAAAFTWKP